MENEYFLNAGVSPPARFEPEMRFWNSFAVAQELSCSNPNWDKQFDNFNHLDSSLSKMVSSPIITFPPEYFASPFNSPSVQQCGQFLNQFAKEKPPHLEINSFAAPPNPILPVLSADPGFVERAAKFSCFGSRSFNGRRSDLGINDTQLPQGSSAPVMGSSKLQRVWSSPTLKQDQYGSPMANKKPTKLTSVCPNSNQESSISEQVLTWSKTPRESNPKKRKSAHGAKPKEEEASVDDSKTEKRTKSIEVSGSENGGSERKMEANNGDDQKPPELSKDYIHVRARRGQATDSHSLAERVRREKIGERMKFLQDLVPGCNKVTGKALMLDEIINYVKSLQGKVEFLSMKLASVNTIECNFKSNDKLQPHSLYSIDSSVQNFQGQYSVDSVAMDSDTTSYQNLQELNGFTEGLPQFNGYCEDNLHSILQTGFSQNLEKAAVPVPVAVAAEAHSPDDTLFFSRRYEL